MNVRILVNLGIVPALKDQAAADFFPLETFEPLDIEKNRRLPKSSDVFPAQSMFAEIHNRLDVDIETMAWSRIDGGIPHLHLVLI